MLLACVPSVLASGPWQDLTPLFHSSSLGWNKRIEYTPGAGSLALFPSIHLETCDEPLWNIQATVELQTNHVAKGCDRDNYSEKSLRKLCGELILPCAKGSCGTAPLAPSPGGVHGGGSVPHTAEMLGDTFLTSAVVSGAGGTPSSHAVLRGRGRPAHICKGLPVLSLLGSQRLLSIAPVPRVCGTFLSTDGKVAIFLQTGGGL